MTKARKYTVQDNLSACYHIIDRCVQRVFLMGTDPLTGVCYDHRKIWFHQRLSQLTKIFTLQLGGYAIMDNHYHLCIKTRPDLTEKLSDFEVANRWFLLYPPKTKKSITTPDEQLSAHIADLLKNPYRINIYRKRLGELSWFMKSLNEFIAVKGNQENNSKGRFWQGRYHSKLLTTQEATLMVQTYIDLNPIRAGIAETPETSEHTSAYDRIHHKENRIKLKEAFAIHRKNKNENKELKTNKNLTTKKMEEIKKMFRDRNKANCLAPFYQGKNHERPFFRITQKEYLELLDWSGREIRSDKKGGIPFHLKSIFDRLEIDRDQWIDSLKNYDNWFYRIVGKISKAWEMLKHTASKCFKGTKTNKALFGT